MQRAAARFQPTPPPHLKRAPTFEGAQKARCDLRIFLVELQDNRRDELIAAAIRRIELRLVAGRESAD